MVEIFGQLLSAAGNELGTDFRISNVGADGDVSRGSSSPAVAYNSIAGDYLVTWQADGVATDEEFEIFGQVVSAAGTEVGADFRISDVGTDGDTTRNAIGTDLAYNPAVNEYLVTWVANLLSNGEYEIFGQRVSAAGSEVGEDIQISNVGMDGDVARGATSAAVAANPNANEYLVTWIGNPDLEKGEVWGQRISGAGAEVGSDFRISNAGPAPVAYPGLAYNPTADEYLVIWEQPFGEHQIFGQLTTGAGTNLGADFQISQTARGADNAAVAYSSTANQYMVTWSGDGLATNDEIEIFGQSVTASGARLGGECRISRAGTDGDPYRGAFNPDLAYNSTADEYLVAWQGDALATDEEDEIFGRRLAQSSAPCDNTQPDTEITDGPKKMVRTKKRKAKARFSFTATEPGSTFECKLDDGVFEPCTPPHVVKVKKGKHTFEVRAEDAAGNGDPTPATYDWKVKKKRKKKN